MNVTENARNFPSTTPPVSNLLFHDAMRRRIKITLKVMAVVSLLLFVAAMFVPLFEGRCQYCFYCGSESQFARVLGLPLPRSETRKSIYRDLIVMPSHPHRMIECNGVRIWAFRGQQCWDEFGWTGKPCRNALIDGINRTPELEKEIIETYLMINPEDREGIQRFLDAYVKKETEQDVLERPR